MYTLTPVKRSSRRAIDITQGSPETKGFKKGYVSYTADSRTPLDALSDMTNITLEQDNLPRPRESLVLYGSQPLGTGLGFDTFIKIVAGLPEKWDISMQVVGGVGKVVVRKDGGTWTASTGAGNSYSATAVATFCQSGNRVYVSNKTNAMSYLDLSTDAIVVYSALANPSAPTPVKTAMAGAIVTHYYKITANNAVGESAASSAGSTTSGKYRDAWILNTDFMTVSWSAVVGATGYNVYYGTDATNMQYVTTVLGNATVSFIDLGDLPLNAFKRAPDFNSTAGPILETMWNKDGQLYGVGDTTNPDFVWYDGGSDAVGDFSSNAGGNVSVNYGGDTVPTAVRSFRTGKGDSAITVLSRGIAGRGKMHHIVFTSTVFDGYTINLPSVYEVNGQSGTVSARATVEAQNSLHYPTGREFKSTGTAQNVMNILSTGTTSADIIPDVRNLSLSAMNKSCALVYEDKIHWALPVGSATNNQIWVKDLSRGGIWIMPWIIRADFMWLSEDNVTGLIHFCIYDGTNVLEFSRSTYTNDNGVPFTTRVAHDGIVFSPHGMDLAAIQTMRAKLLNPKGSIRYNATGINEDGGDETLATEAFIENVSFSGWSQLTWSDPVLPSMWSDDIGIVDFYRKAIAIIPLEVDETVNQLAWEIVTDATDTDFVLSTTNIQGIGIKNSYLETQ